MQVGNLNTRVLVKRQTKSSDNFGEAKRFK